jgi:lysozyme family protein
MTQNDILRLILDEEGGYTNDPDDPGGETNFGISKRSYPNLDIKSLTRQQAIDIYIKDYWNPLQLQEFDSNMALMIMDCGVNQGTHRAIIILQKCLGVTEDGIIGSKTIAAYKATGLPYSEYAAQRLAHYGSLPTFKKYGLGWCRRVMRVTIKCALG